MTDSSLTQRVISALIEQIPQNPAMGARLRRASNPDLEYLAWEYLVRFGISLDNDHQRRAFVLAASALATEKPAKDGEWSIARCLLESERKNDSTAEGPAGARFRRLLACSDQEELCRILRPILRLVMSRAAGRLSYERLLRDTLYFGPKVKERWAQEFYSWKPVEEAEA